MWVQRELPIEVPISFSCNCRFSLPVFQQRANQVLQHIVFHVTRDILHEILYNIRYATIDMFLF